MSETSDAPVEPVDPVAPFAPGAPGAPFGGREAPGPGGVRFVLALVLLYAITSLPFPWEELSIAESLLRGEFKAGDLVVVSHEEKAEELSFEGKPSKPEPDEAEVTS